MSKLEKVEWTQFSFLQGMSINDVIDLIYKGDLKGKGEEVDKS